MKRWWQILVLGLAIVSLLAPASLSCTASLHPAEHECCAPQAQLTAPSCCQSGATNQTALPPNTGDQANGELASLPATLRLIVVQPATGLQRSNSIPPPILLPATILRT